MPKFSAYTRFDYISLSSAAILSLASPANAMTLQKTQSYNSSLQYDKDIFQQFDGNVGTLKKVTALFSVNAKVSFKCGDTGCALENTRIVGGANFGSSGFNVYSSAGTRGLMPNATGLRSAFAFRDGELSNIFDFIGTGRIGTYSVNNYLSFLGTLSYVDLPKYDVNATLTYLYEEPDPIPLATSVPTPAVLPGLIGMGIAALRKKGKKEEFVAQEN